MLRFICKTKTLQRAEEIRDIAKSLNPQNFSSGYVGICGVNEYLVFLRFESNDVFRKWSLCVKK